MAIFYRFTSSDLQDGEKVVYRMHPSSVSFLVRARSGFFWFILGCLIFWGLTKLVDFSLERSLEIATFVIFVSGIPFLVGAWITTRELINWFFDEGIVTNKRVVSIDQDSFFYKKLSSVDLEEISDVVIHERGLIHSIFHIGTLDVKTASRAGSIGVSDLIIRDIHFPQRVHKLLDRLILLRNESGVNYAKVCEECGLKSG
jgi:hypothetical protein